MTTKPAPICGQHKQVKEWKQTTFEYNEDGITVRVFGIYAWGCAVDGEAATADEVREWLEPAKRARARRSMLTEYIVSVSSAERLRPAA